MEGRITKVDVHYGETINLGEFNSALVDSGMSVEVPVGTDARKIFKEAFKEVEIQVKERIELLKTRGGLGGGRL